jgi:KUP system potassium uptake protein
MSEVKSSGDGTFRLGLGALGVVYGDIGTSPLYAMRECFHGPHAVPVSPENVYGIVSLIFWAMTLIVSVKYLLFVMRADNRGEGGELALMSLAISGPRRRGTGVLLLVGLFGASLLYGDGIITPAISVLSAVEGLKVAAPGLSQFIIPVTVTILVALFALQRIGTGRVGVLFGPIMVVWFAVLALLGIAGLLHAPGVLAGLNPWHGIRFFWDQGWAAFGVLGSVFLVVTGAEALYADMGHFGAPVIRRVWFMVVFPSLMLNYLGQGALLLEDPAHAENPFYRLAPEWALYPLIVLATAAAVIASQALISGAFSISMQAVQLGYLPRMQIRHTSQTTRGQIYMPQVNWFLMLACIGLVVGFQSSTGLAAAYGLGVSTTMVLTTILFFGVVRNRWGWGLGTALLFCSGILLIELAFFSANLLKFKEGGWFPLLVALLVFALMTTWLRGRTILRTRLEKAILPLEDFLDTITPDSPPRVRGVAVFMSGNRQGVPLALLHNLKHNKVLHAKLILLTIRTSEVPFVGRSERLQVESLKEGVYRITGCYGFMEEPNVPALLEQARRQGLEIKLEEITYFLSRETILPSRRRGMALWREYLFAFLSRNAQPATAFFHLPPNRVVELGMQVEI